VGRERDTEREKEERKGESEKRVGEREGAYLTDSRKSSGLERGRACLIARKNKTNFFFWFSIDQFEFSVDSHFLTLPNTGKRVKPFIENVLHRNKQISL
jgi:hypothetical protein